MCCVVYHQAYFITSIHPSSEPVHLHAPCFDSVLMCSCHTWQVWLLKGKKDDMYRAMWEKAMDETAAQLTFSKGNLTYIAELQRCAPADMVLPAWRCAAPTPCRFLCHPSARQYSDT